MHSRPDNGIHKEYSLHPQPRGQKVPPLPGPSNLEDRRVVPKELDSKARTYNLT